MKEPNTMIEYTKKKKLKSGSVISERIIISECTFVRMNVEGRGIKSNRNKRNFVKNGSINIPSRVRTHCHHTICSWVLSTHKQIKKSVLFFFHVVVFFQKLNSDMLRIWVSFSFLGCSMRYECK